jgi:hypothetical protein
MLDSDYASGPDRAQKQRAIREININRLRSFTRYKKNKFIAKFCMYISRLLGEKKRKFLPERKSRRSDVRGNEFMYCDFSLLSIYIIDIIPIESVTLARSLARKELQARRGIRSTRVVIWMHLKSLCTSRRASHELLIFLLPTNVENFRNHWRGKQANKLATKRRPSGAPIEHLKRPNDSKVQVEG